MRKAIYFCIVAILLLFGIYVFNKPMLYLNTSTVDANLGFIDLNDTPNSYSTQALKLVRVKADETGLEYVSPGGLVDTNCDNNPLCVLTGRVNSLFDANVSDLNADSASINGITNIRATTANALNVENASGTDIFNVNTSTTVISSRTIRPTSTLSQDLGISSLIWRSIWARDANLTNINFTGVLSGGDFNYSLLDANMSQSCPAGQALSSVGNVTTCTAVGSGSVDGNGSILGTSNQVNVTNGLSRLFNDSNVVLSLPQNIDGGATPQFVGLTLSPCSTFQVDTSPQLRFKVDCSGNLVTSATIIPAQPGVSDIGNTSNRWDDLFITDINATGSSDFKNLLFDGNRVLTENDSNNMFLKLYSTATQVITGAVSNIIDFNGNIRPLITQKWNLGSAALRWETVFAGKFNANPGVGQPSMVIQPNTGAFCVSGTDVCLDYNSLRFIGITDSNNPVWLWGITGNASGLGYQLPKTTNPQYTTIRPEGQFYVKDFNNGRDSVQLFRYRNGVWEHDSAKITLGTPKDLIFDGNWTGDINASGSYRIDGNIVVDKNIYGQLISPGNLVGVSCNTTCGAYSYAGPWTCVEATNITGAASTCTDITVAHNCLCRN